MIVVLLATAGCKESEVNQVESFITSYYTADYVEATVVDGNNVKFRFWGNTIMSGSEFLALCEANSDTSYPNNKPSTAIGPRTALSSGVSSMKITTAEDFDVNHPAGSNISDIVTCFLPSYYQFVHNGYVFAGYDDSPVGGGYGISTVSCRVSDICYENTLLATPFFWMLSFDTHPAEKGLHKFRLSIETGGRKLTEDFSLVFE